VPNLCTNGNAVSNGPRQFKMLKIPYQCQLTEVVKNRRMHCAVPRCYCDTAVIISVNDIVGELHGVYIT